MSILAVYSNKGGVGKTSTAVNIAYLAAASGRNTLIMDLDSQGSSSYYFRTKSKLKKKTRGLTNSGKAIEKSIKSTDYDHLDILPADLSHRNLDLDFYDAKKSKSRLKKVLKPLNEEYDTIVIDCPPTLAVLAENVFNAADCMLVPLVPTTLSARSFEQLLEFFDANGYKRQMILPFLSMLDGRKNMHKAFRDALSDKYDALLSTVIPHRSQVEQMGLEQKPIRVFAARSAAAKAYKQLWQELIRGGHVD